MSIGLPAGWAQAMRNWRVRGVVCVLLLFYLAGRVWPEAREHRVAAAPPLLRGVVLLGMVEGGESPDRYRKYEVHFSEGRIALAASDSITGPYDRRIELPHRLGGEMRGCAKSPLVPSPDARYTAYCFERVEDDGRLSRRVFNNQFEVVDATVQRKVFTAALPEDRRIDGIFWSPNARAVAILSTTERMSFGPLDLLAAITGHRTPLVSVYLDAYDLQSRQHAEFPIREGAEHGSAVILDWWF
jgi:hypothetical protein